MNDFHSRSRVDKFEKRRKNTKTMTVFIGLGSILFFVLLITFIFGNSNSETQNNQNPDVIANDDEENEDGPLDSESSQRDHNENEAEHEENNQEDTEDNNQNDSDDEDAIQRESSDDDNVIDAYSKNWDPIGTEQSEPHVVQFDEDSQDWAEMKTAIHTATDLDDLEVWRIENGGDQKVIATVTPEDQSENYRVYLSWVTDEGWQPTKIEVLEVNDKHPDYEDDQEE